MICIYSVIFNRPVDVSQYLSLTFDSATGLISGATAATITWVEQVNATGETAASGVPVSHFGIKTFCKLENFTTKVEKSGHFRWFFCFRAMKSQMISQKK